MTYEDYGDKLKERAKEEAIKKAKEEIAKPVSRELVKFSDAVLEQGYKVSYEIAEDNLPPTMSRELERQLRISTDKIKSENERNLNEATTKLIATTTGTLIDVVKGDKNFDEASCALANKSTSVVKTIIIERTEKVIIAESERIGKKIAGQASQKIIRKVTGSNNPVLNAIAFGDIVKDLAFDWADGKISDEQFVKLVIRRCTVLALQGLAKGLPGGIFASTAIEHACNEIFALMDVMNAGLDAASKRRSTISKIKSEALAEMNRQRGLMEKYFADEKLTWDKNIQAGFKLISEGTHSNDVEVIAQGLDKILQNFDSQVAFTNREDFRKDFRRRKIVVNL